MHAEDIELVELEIIPAMSGLVGRLQSTPSHEKLRLLLASIIADQPNRLPQTNKPAHWPRSSGCSNAPNSASR